ncbi:hypothetical protein SAMN05421678_109273 [Actinopolymorpha cephalotaxi]|uniref:Uncharacterized protein n=1 Tax=Actinopolymorpha cephalotaxi TaxID=504797 RepID=A0A1I2VNS3_9ACTN|nr:hypothetical protein [Actinopolymorpha cephalotaxi]NYH83234.1 hypothetical protein [Actinopolymorpha cephalotaxi]SFG90938.1 hypothetical protein SAMN05421678_109273 [Actinopolymorpha cephalotaxi]
MLTAVRRVRSAIPVPVRRVMSFDLRGMVSIALWIARRRHGVPTGATAVSYSRAQTPLTALFLFFMVVELVALEVVLRALHAPVVLRSVFLLVDAYAVVAVLAMLAAAITRPHVVSAQEVRVRYGAFFDLRVPRDRIAAVRRAGNHNESGMVTVAGDQLAVAVSSQTNLVLDLTEPVTVVRPLGRQARVRTVRFYADDPVAAHAALRPAADDRQRQESV